jgi:hypothetical protein
VLTQLRLNISYHISYHIISYHIYHIIYNITSYRIILYHIMSCHVMSFRFISSCHVMSCHIIYHIIFCRNTTHKYIHMYNLLKYKRQHVSVPLEPTSGQFDSLGLRTLCVCVCVCVCAYHGIPICLQYHESQV